MNGWQRLMVVISGLWCLCVSGYYYYEYINFPIDPEMNYTSLEPGIQSQASNFYLISIIMNERYPNGSDPDIEKELRDAVTPEQKQFLYDVLHNSWIYTPETNWKHLFILLFIPIFLFLVLSNSIRWVCRGFKKTNT